MGVPALSGPQPSRRIELGGVTVDLLNAAGTSILGVTTTNASGLYSFTNLAAGAAGMAKILFLVFLAMAVITFFINLVR